MVRSFSIQTTFCSLTGCRNEDFEAFAREVDSKSPEEIKKYYAVFKKKWKELSGMSMCRNRYRR